MSTSTSTYGYFIGIGSNIQPKTNFIKIIQQLVQLFGQIELSRILETEPVTIERDNKFVNAVSYIESNLDKDLLKQQLTQIETDLG